MTKIYYRGGSWYGGARVMRAANRGRYAPSWCDYRLGFRIVRSFE